MEERNNKEENTKDKIIENKIPISKKRPFLYDINAFDQIENNKSHKKGRYTVAAKSLNKQRPKNNVPENMLSKNPNKTKGDVNIPVLQGDETKKSEQTEKFNPQDFGTHYYKNGELCYVGYMKNQNKNGLGAIFSLKNKNITVSAFKDDKNIGNFSQFDKNGDLIFNGRVEDGNISGIRFSYNKENNHTFIHRQNSSKASLTHICEFDENGNLIYYGDINNHKKEGFGIQFGASSEIIYSGNFKNDKYNGEGTLYFPEGGMVQGSFENGKVCGFAVEFDSDGCKIYEGEFENNIYNGKGCKYLKTGAYYEGKFENGSPVGELIGYDSNGMMTYKGNIVNDRYNGKGIYYFNNQVVYEGEFKNNLYNGLGKEYQDDGFSYEGEFKNNKRYGFGTSFKDNKPIYKGYWKDDLYDGLGMLYSNGQIRYLGEFKNGKMNGRINKVENNTTTQETICSNNKITYMRKFSLNADKTLNLEYEGFIEHNLPNGSGCSFDEYGDKINDGYFKNGDFEYPIQISKSKQLPALKTNSILEKTEYSKHKDGASYLLNRDFGTFKYTGNIKNNKPIGKGTLVFKDHKFKGEFKDGKPCGNGMIIQNNKVILSGVFKPFFVENCKIINMNDIKYFYIKN